MAILKHTGAFSGRLGTVVGYRRHEKNFLRKAPRRTAPPTEKELVNRYCFKLVQEWLHPIQEFINQGFRNCGRSTAANAARSHLHHHALQRQGYASVIDPSLVKVSRGDVGLPATNTVVLEGRQLHFSWDPAIDATRDPRDRVMLLAYAPGFPPYYELWGPRRSAGTASLDLSPARPGHYHLYLAFSGKDGESQSDSRYLGMISI